MDINVQIHQVRIVEIVCWLGLCTIAALTTNTTQAGAVRANNTVPCPLCPQVRAEEKGKDEQLLTSVQTNIFSLHLRCT